MLVSRVGFFLLSVMITTMGCDEEDTATKNEASQNELCLDSANEVIDIMTDCKTAGQSWQDCSSQLGNKVDAVSECFDELAKECENKESDELKDACQEQLMNDFAPIEIKMKKTEAEIALSSCDEQESEELRKTCTEELEERIRGIERLEYLESKQTDACLEIADEVIDMMTECETADESWRSCRTKITGKLKDIATCFTYFTVKCEDKANDDLQEACKKEIRDSYKPFEIEIEKIKARIKSND